MITKIIIEGVDYSGKKSLYQKIRNKIENIEIQINGILKEQYELHWSKWDKSKNDKNSIIIILEATPEKLLERAQLKDNNNQNYTLDKFFLIRYRYRQLSAFYGNNIHLIDTTLLSIDEISNITLSIIKDNNLDYIIPSINDLKEEEYEKLPIVIEGESKIVRQYNKRFQIIKYKPTVHSFKQKRSGIVEGTDKERMKMTKNIIDIFSRYSLKHSYFYIGENYILNESKNPEIDLPPVEVIVKRCFVGSDKVRYYNLEKLKNRFGKPMLKNWKNEYQKLLVRFDYRNPNINPDTNLPLGDLPLCDDLADEFLNSEIAKKTAKKCFTVLDEHFSKMNLYFEDVCFMLDVNGDTMYGEVSQDCGRYKYVEEDKLTDLDKDVWRNWGSFEIVLKQYQMLTNMIEKYVKKNFYGIE